MKEIIAILELYAADKNQRIADITDKKNDATERAIIAETEVAELRRLLDDTESVLAEQAAVIEEQSSRIKEYEFHLNNAGLLPKVIEIYKIARGSE